MTTFTVNVKNMSGYTHPFTFTQAETRFVTILRRLSRDSQNLINLLSLDSSLYCSSRIRILQSIENNNRTRCTRTNGPFTLAV